MTLLPRLFLVWFFNLVIAVRSHRRKLHFMDEPEIKTLLTEGGFRVARIRRCFADTELFCEAYRPNLRFLIVGSCPEALLVMLLRVVIPTLDQDVCRLRLEACEMSNDEWIRLNNLCRYFRALETINLP